MYHNTTMDIKKTFNLKAFSLIELAISLIVISILISSVSIVTEMIKQAKIRTIAKELRTFKTSITMFKESYNGLPGDLINATTFWTSCTNQTTPVINNCNGNGDNVIQLSYEGMRLWEHLSLAELIPGTYIGKDTIGNGNQFNPNKNSPKLAIATGCYNGESKNSNSTWYGISSDMVITAGKFSTNTSCQDSLFTPDDSLNIDIKIDDAIATTGMILATEGESIKVSNPNDCVNTDYNLDITKNSCRILYKVLP